MTILKIKKRTNPYLQIDKTGIEDENLSWRARGMLAYLIGRPPNWEVSVNQLTKASDSDGRRAVQSTLKELEQANYLIRYPYHNPETGLMDGWKSIVFETPSDCQDWKAENTDTKVNFPTDTFCVHREDARRSTRPTETVRQIIIEDQQEKNLIISPSIISLPEESQKVTAHRNKTVLLRRG